MTIAQSVLHNFFLHFTISSQNSPSVSALITIYMLAFLCGFHVCLNGVRVISLLLSHVIQGFVCYHKGAAIFVPAFLLYALTFESEAESEYRKLKKRVFDICEEIHAKECRQQQQLQQQRAIQKQQQQQQQQQRQQQQLGMNRRSVGAMNAANINANATDTLPAPDASQSFLGILIFQNILTISRMNIDNNISSCLSLIPSIPWPIHSFIN